MLELVALAAVAVVAWFAAGTIINVRKGRALMRWMQGGLPIIGSRTSVRWLGSTAVEMVIRDAQAPFTAATLVIFLEPRDLPWMWVLGRASGRRDTLIIRGLLHKTPHIELEALDPISWSGREALPRVPEKWLVREAAAPGNVIVHHASAAALAQADTLVEIARRAGLSCTRLSVRATEPNFQLHVLMPDTRKTARDFFAAVRALAERAIV